MTLMLFNSIIYVSIALFRLYVASEYSQIGIK